MEDINKNFIEFSKSLSTVHSTIEGFISDSSKWGESEFKNEALVEAKTIQVELWKLNTKAQKLSFRIERNIDSLGK